MRSVVPEFYGHDDEALQNIVTTATIALDTNTLLDLYRVGRVQREEILAVLRKVRHRIFIPYQVALEFHRKRLDAVSQNQTVWDGIAAGISGPKVETLNSIRDPSLRRQVDGLIVQITQDFKDRLADLIREHTLRFEDIRDHDPVLEELDSILDDATMGQKPTDDQLKVRREDATKRVKARIPPGFMDASKTDSSGDYLLWAEILDHAKGSDRPMLLVTRDIKEDWYRKTRGQMIGPNDDLIREMRDALPSHPYHQITPGTLLHYAKTYLEADVTESTIEAVERIPRSLWAVNRTMLDGSEIPIRMMTIQPAIDRALQRAVSGLSFGHSYDDEDNKYLAILGGGDLSEYEKNTIAHVILTLPYDYIGVDFVPGT
jgi:hypothetical protein